MNVFFIFFLQLRRWLILNIILPINILYLSLILFSPRFVYNDVEMFKINILTSYKQDVNLDRKLSVKIKNRIWLLIINYSLGAQNTSTGYYYVELYKKYFLNFNWIIISFMDWTSNWIICFAEWIIEVLKYIIRFFASGNMWNPKL